MPAQRASYIAPRRRALDVAASTERRRDHGESDDRAIELDLARGNAACWVKVMRNRSFWFLLAPVGVSGAIFGFACGGSSASPDAPDGAAAGDASGEAAVDPSGACAAYAAARCQKFDSCTMNLYSREHFESASACASREVLACTAALAAADTAATPAFFAASAFVDHGWGSACL